MSDLIPTINLRYPVAAVFLVISLLAAPAPLPAEPRFVFETGTPPWKGERLDLPPDFAPDLDWAGVEHIRFAPGMFQSDAPDFFSYILVFLLEPGSDTSKAGLESGMLVYYTGLSKAVMAGKNLAVDTSRFRASLEEATKTDGVPHVAKEANSWAGTLDWIEPFATQKPQKLYLEIHVWNHEGKLAVMSCVSPGAPDMDVPWKTLREIGTRFRFDT